MKKIFNCLFLVMLLLPFNCVLAFSIEKDLNFLKDLSNEDLSPLVAIIKNEKNIQLTDKEKNNPQKYLNKIIDNFEQYAINELNIKNYKKVSYKQILESVCKRENLQFNENLSVKDLGTVFVRHMFVDTFNKMSKRQKEDLVGVLREAMSEEEFEEFLEKIGGTSGFLISSGETINDFFLSDYSGDFIMAVCLAADIAGAVNENQPRKADEQTVIYKGIVPAITYIETLRVVKTQMPKTAEDNSDFINMLIVVAVPVFCVLLFLICIDPRKRAILIKIINFLLICLFISIMLLFVMVAMESADKYIVVVFVICVIFVSMLFNWIFSIQREIIKRRLKKKISKRSNNRRKLKILKALKERNGKEKSISKITCPKCNAQNSKTNYSCTNCHYVFDEKDKENKINGDKKKEGELNNATKVFNESKSLNNKYTEQNLKEIKKDTEKPKNEKMKQKNDKKAKNKEETKMKTRTAKSKKTINDIG